MKRPNSAAHSVALVCTVAAPAAALLGEPRAAGFALALGATTALYAPADARRGLKQGIWGLILLAPYAVVFVVFVMYPVGYGLWLARHPASYGKLFEDPVFLRSVFNTLAFLVIAINVKMMIALVLSGFFVVARPWIKWLSLLFILPWAVPSIPTT